MYHRLGTALDDVHVQPTWPVELGELGDLLELVAPWWFGSIRGRDIPAVVVALISKSVLLPALHLVGPGLLGLGAHP
jgi:hypothetical protein